MNLLGISLIIILIQLSISNSIEEIGLGSETKGNYDKLHGKSSDQAVILILGDRSSGKFSLIESLAQQKLQRNTSSKDIIEYGFNVDLEHGQEAKLKIVKVPAMGSNSPFLEADVISTVEEYLQNSNGGHFPTAVFILSNFDDTRFDGNHSTFVRMLKGIEKMKGNFGAKTSESNILFVLTHFMSITKNEQKDLEKKVKSFKRVIGNYTEFPNPIYISLAENKGEEYELEKDLSGFFKLPNKELFPQNIFAQTIAIAKNLNDTQGEKILTAAFSKRLGQPDILIFKKTEESEVDLKLNQAYHLLENVEKFPEELNQIKVIFKSLGIKSLEEIPKTEGEIVSLVRKLPRTQLTAGILLKAFSINIPVFTSQYLAGFGFDLLHDHFLENSPFKAETGKFVLSQIGFEIPVMLTCQAENETLDIFQTFPTKKSYFDFRVLSLTKGTANITEGSPRPGFNVLDPNKELSMTALKEIRTFSFELRKLEEIPLDEEFKSRIHELTRFDPSERESPKDWKSFFNHYGTHLVRKAFGGGSMEVTLNGPKMTLDPDSLFILKNHMLGLKSLPGEFDSLKGRFSYTYEGGTPNDPRMIKLNEIQAEEANELLNDWELSLESSPKMLQTDVELIPIYIIAGLVDESKEEMVKEALDLHLQGRLVYTRRKKPTEEPKRKTTTRMESPKIDTTTETVKNDIFTETSTNEGSISTLKPIKIITSNPSFKILPVTVKPVMSSTKKPTVLSGSSSTRQISLFILFCTSIVYLIQPNV